MRRLVTAAFALCAAACGPAEEEAAPRIELSDTATIEQGIRRDDDGIIIMNGLDPAKLGENLLTTNETSRAELISRPLSTASFATTTLNYAVRYDQRSQAVLAYIVRCALGPTDAPVSVAGQTYPGELGLCRAWATGGITSNVTCQRHVTACLLGLSNAVDAHVPVSTRGQGANLSPAATMHPYPRQADGSLHPVFSSCGVATAGVRHNCGWQPMDDAAARLAGIAKVFACVPGATIRLGAGSACTGARLGDVPPGSDKVLRVCSGIGPCLANSADPSFLGQSEGACGTYKPEVVFTCPGSGEYVVMQRDYYVANPPGPRGTMIVGHLTPPSAKPEALLFPAREGAFFGSLFTGSLGRRVTLSWSPTQTAILTTTIVGNVVYSGAYSCEDAAFRDEVAYRTARLCTLTYGHCLSTATGICQGDATHTRVCDGINGPSATGSFYGCWSPSGVKYDEGLTTFLRTPCDLIGSSAACKLDN